MSKKQPLLAKDLIKILEKNPEAIIAVSDYFGCDHVLYHPDVTLIEKDDPLDGAHLSVESGGDFVNNKGKFKRQTIYIGHPKYK